MLAYFSGCMLATAAGTWLLPEPLAVYAPLLILMVEVPQIVQNGSVRWGLGVPF